MICNASAYSLDCGMFQHRGHLFKLALVIWKTACSWKLQEGAVIIRRPFIRGLLDGCGAYKPE